jgi:hypothetical protein
LYVLHLIVMSGPRGALPAIIGMFATRAGVSVAIQYLNMVVPALMFIFGAVVTTMTWLRARATPDVACALVPPGLAPP